MDLTTQYQQTAQKQLDYVDAVSKAFEQKCNELKSNCEKSISALDSKSPTRMEQETNLKMQLKTDLQTVLQQYETEIRKSFSHNLDDLENIYREKEKERIAEIEKMILTLS
ncbi:hypothetical protein IT411_04275 [Candidatus Peregrinibacteria bacterium]|nr:hypothetical protein [Candidatus Peregrinibacteria bacterium]